MDREYDYLPVTDADIANALETQLRRFVDAGGQVSRDRIPRHKSAFNQLTVDPQGNVWVRLVSADVETGTTWDVFDPEGRYMGDVQLPDVRIPVAAAAVRPVIHEDALWVVGSDEFDVPYVVRYAIARP